MKTIKQIGNWILDDVGIHSTKVLGFLLEKSRLWETVNILGDEIWDWPHHLAPKTWINSEDMQDFNNIFIYAQDYFKDVRPSGVDNISFDKTIEYQQLNRHKR